MLSVVPWLPLLPLLLAFVGVVPFRHVSAESFQMDMHEPMAAPDVQEVNASHSTVMLLRSL